MVRFVILLLSFISTAYAIPPDVAGQWYWEGKQDATKLILNQNNMQVRGRIAMKNGEGWDVDGTVDDHGVVTLNRWIPVTEYKTTRRTIVEQLLAIYGDPAHPEMFRGKMNLRFDAAKLELRGTYTRIAHRSYGDSLISHEEVVENMFVTRGTMLPDLVVNFFSIEPFEGKDVNGNPIPQWHVQAEVKNVGFVPSTERFRIQLVRKNTFGPNPNPPEYVIARSATHLQRLEPGESAMIDWKTDRETDQTSPPNITPRDNEISVDIDTENLVLEGFENNNRKTLVRLDCADPEQEFNALHTVWVENSNPPPGNLKYIYDVLLGKISDQKQQVLCYIRLEAQRRAKAMKATAAGSNLLSKIDSLFLRDYFANPSREAGQAALEKLGEGQGYPGVGLGAYMYVPEGLRAIYSSDPAFRDHWEWLYPATQFWRSPGNGKYISEIPFLDVPFLVGRHNSQPGEEDDAIYGGKNLSNVMHWATGAKYQYLPDDAMRDLFIGYEYWHMEGFDVFGEDSLNDLIGEEAGRLMGKQIAQAQIRSRLDLLKTVDRSFEEARAWVGTMIRIRQKELDAAILSDTPPQTHMWMSRYETLQPWSGETIAQRLSNGASVAEVMETGFVSQLADIYALRYHADQWDAQNGPIQLSPVTQKALRGEYNDQFKAAPKKFGDKWEWRP